MQRNHGLRAHHRPSLGGCMLYLLKSCVFVVFCFNPLSLPKLVYYWTQWIYPDRSALYDMHSISAARQVMSHQGSNCFRARQRRWTRKWIGPQRFPHLVLHTELGCLTLTHPHPVCHISHPDDHLHHCGQKNHNT
jgi:hypothetical protein